LSWITVMYAPSKMTAFNMRSNERHLKSVNNIW
jgi:hypothetical protein